MHIPFWRKWHRWIGVPSVIFLLWAATTGVCVAFTEFFGADEALREANRELISPITVSSADSDWSAPMARAFTTASQQFPSAPVDKVEVEFKGEHPRVTVFTGKPTGGEDRKLVFDAHTGALVANETYADKPFLYRLHSGEAFGDGGLVVAMFWGTALALMGASGAIIYLHMYNRMKARHESGVRRVFW
jgi:uncharacterized iron-regulated membrane protein